MVQIFQGLSPVRTHQNTYDQNLFCERLYIDNNHEVMNQILSTEQIICVIIGGYEDSIITIQVWEYI